MITRQHESEHCFKKKHCIKDCWPNLLKLKVKLSLGRNCAMYVWQGFSTIVMSTSIPTEGPATSAMEYVVSL